MRGEKLLLLLAVFMILGRCQPKPTVSRSPQLNEIFSGDLFYLKCENNGGGSGGTVNWYFNDYLDKSSSTDYFKIAVAHSEHSGRYHCEISGQNSSYIDITVLDYMPIATLTLKTGQPVMQKGASVILNLHNDDGIQGWICWVYRGTREKKIVLKNTTALSLDFQPRQLQVPETIFWCTHKNEDIRSNQIVVRTSERPVSLEMYHLPAVVGQSLTMRCLVWGTDEISKTVFYKNDKIFSQSSNVHEISKVTDAENGVYRCHATYRYKAHTDGPSYEEDSDVQDLLVQVSPIKAALFDDMSCSCERCTDDAHYHWYYMNGSSWAHYGTTKPNEAGTYACRAVWKNKRSVLSNPVVYQTINTLLLVIFLLVTLLLAAVVFLYFLYKRRNNTERVYEDMPLRSRDTVDKGEPEYDTLNPEAPDKKKTGGEYEPLKKEEMKEGVYHTLGTEGAAGGEGGYQALKKGEMKEGVYHTLGTEGAAGGEGGYQALKKGEMKEGVYHTLGTEGAAGGEGGYQALKKGEMKEGEYHTLGTEGATGGEGGKQAQGKENKDKEYEIVSEKVE